MTQKRQKQLAKQLTDQITKATPTLAARQDFIKRGLFRRLSRRSTKSFCEFCIWFSSHAPCHRRLVILGLKTCSAPVVKENRKGLGTVQPQSRVKAGRELISTPPQFSSIHSVTIVSGKTMRRPLTEYRNTLAQIPTRL